MKTGLALIAILAMFAVVSAADAVNCGNLTLKADCSASDTCNWTADATQNKCTQLVDCSAVKVADCANDTNSKNCNLTGQSCADNTNVCSDNANCDTQSGCKSTSTCNPVAGGFNCAQYNTQQPSKTCTQTAAWCIQDPDAKPTCSYGASCPATSTTACLNPCQTTSVVCQTNAACSPAAPTADNCTAANGCTFTPAEGQTAATCAASTDCSAVNTANGCTAANGCSIKTYNCAATQAEITTYCTNLGANCNTDPAGELYCIYDQNKTCKDKDNYCVATNGNVCAATSPQCTVTTTCSNPQSGKCSANTTQDNCTANLCTWTPANTCSNITTNQQCQALTTAATCVTAQTPGCSFTEGGKCSTKSSGGNDTPQPSTTSGPIVVFSCAVLALVFAF